MQYIQRLFLASLMMILLFAPPATAEAILPGSLTVIEEQAFMGDAGLTGTLIIPDGVTEIGAEAFRDCTGLTGVVIPDSVTTISAGAFSGCTGLSGNLLLRYYVLADSTSFDGCAGLTVRQETDAANFIFSASDNAVTITGVSSSFTGGEVIVPQTIDGLPVRQIASMHCANLTDVTLPYGITTIERNAFFSCRNLERITLPGSITSIGTGAFDSCESLTEIVLPNSVTSIGDEAFNHCSSLTQVTLPDSIASIGTRVFNDCTSLASVTMPASVTTIGESAFCGCTSLADVVIPNSVTTIGEDAFCGCTGLTAITIPDNVKNIGERAFYQCSALTSVTFPETAITLDAYSFAGTALTGRITFPVNSVIADTAFSGCPDLTYEVWTGNEENPGNVFTWNEHKYQVFDEYKTWNEAEAYCRSLGGYLLTITSAAEQAAVEAMLDQCGRNNYFIGATDKDNEGVWKWTTGEVFSYSRWGKNSPDNFRGKEHYLSIWNIEQYGSDKHGWNDHTAAGYYSDDEYHLWRSPDQVGFICEWGRLDTSNAEDAEFVELMTRDYLVYLMDNAQSPDTLIGNMEAANNSAFYEEFVYDAVSFAQGHYDELLSTQNKQKYLFHEALKVSSGTAEFELLRNDEKGAIENTATIWKNGAELGESDLFDSIAAMCDDVYLTDLEGTDVAEAFESYYKGSSGADAVYNFLLKEGLTAPKAKAVMESFETLSNFRIVAQAVGGMVSVYDNVIDLYNEFQFLQTLDRNSLRASARVYCNSNDPQMQAVGSRLLVIANADAVEQVQMIAVGYFVDFGLRTYVDTALELAMSLTPGAFRLTVEITNATLNLLTNVGEVPKLVHDLKFAAEAADGTWYVFRNDLAAYHANPTEANLTTAYSSYIVYLTEAKKTQNAFIKLKEDMDKALFVGLSRLTAEVLEMAKQQVNYLENWLYRAQTTYRLRHEGIAAEVNQYFQEWAPASE